MQLSINTDFYRNNQKAKFQNRISLRKFIAFHFICFSIVRLQTKYSKIRMCAHLFKIRTRATTTTMTISDILLLLAAMHQSGNIRRARLAIVSLQALNILCGFFHGDQEPIYTTILQFQ
jgi:hypothetical protein